MVFRHSNGTNSYQTALCGLSGSCFSRFDFAEAIASIPLSTWLKYNKFTMSSLTKKFSRNSLASGAKGQASGAKAKAAGAKVHSIEEEIARTTNKRFSSDSWRKVSPSCRTLPNASTLETHSTMNSNGGVSNTQILSALSSLTEDQAFANGSSDIPVRASASFATNSCFSTNRDDLTISRSLAPSASFTYSARPMRNATNDPSSTSVAASASVSTNQKKSMSRPSLRRVSTDNLRGGLAPSASFSSQNSRTGPSLRTAAGRAPNMTRKVGRRGLPANPLSRAMQQDGQSQATTIQRQQQQHQRPTGKSQGRTLSIQSLVSVFVKFFKLLQHILLLPEQFRQYLTRPKWTGQGRSILITGASSGIGAEIARQYASQGAKLALVARTTEDLDRVANECRELGAGKATYYSADLSNSMSTKLAMQQAISDFGTFDVVVLNAGRSQGCYFEEIKDPSQIDQMIKLNVNGSITSLHYLLPTVPKSKDSRIVVVSNTAGIVASPYQSIYSATKHALTGFSNALRIELKNTYGRESPRVCLVSFPEVSGTKCNSTGRMDMGAKLPPAKWYSWAGIPLARAVHELLPAIASGKREFGPPNRFNVWRSMYAFCPNWVDFRMMKHIQKTHYRPLDENHKQRQKEEVKAPTNRSWAN